MPARKLSVVIPCYNEERTVAEAARGALAAEAGGLAREVIVVDDGSTDASAAAASSVPGVVLLRHERNRGKGAALKTGFAVATGDVLLIQDADLEYDPADYAALVEPIVAGRADAVLGTRFARERPVFFFGPRRSPFFTHYAGNLAIVFLTNLLYGARGTDYEGGYKAFRRDLARSVPVRADGFEFDNELVCRLLRRGARVVEAPIRYSPRSYRDGKKIGWTDGVRMLWTIAKWRLLPDAPPGPMLK